MRLNEIYLIKCHPIKINSTTPFPFQLDSLETEKQLFPFLLSFRGLCYNFLLLSFSPLRVPYITNDSGGGGGDGGGGGGGATFQIDSAIPESPLSPQPPGIPVTSAAVVPQTP